MRNWHDEREPAEGVDKQTHFMSLSCLRADSECNEWKASVASAPSKWSRIFWPARDSEGTCVHACVSGWV